MTRPIVTIPKTKTSKSTKKRHRREAVEFSHDTKKRAAAQYGFRCAVGAAGCEGRIDQYHHRQMKSAGGLGGLANCLPICHVCHVRVHQSVTWATHHGFLVPQWASPDLVRPHFGCAVGCEVDHR